MTEPLLATEKQPTEVQTDTTSTDSSSAEGTEQSQKQEGSPTDGDQAPEKPEAEKPAGAPETYKFSIPEELPEGVVEAEIHDAYEKAARELDLPQDKAQTLFNTTMSGIYRQAMAGQEKQAKEWRAAAEKDSEYGGDKLEENLAIAKKSVKEFGSDGLRELLDDPNGVGNNPEFIRFMYRVGKAVSEDRFVGSNQGQPVDLDDDAALARKFYPNTAS